MIKELTIPQLKKRLFFPSNLARARFSMSEIRAVVKEFSDICADERAVADFKLYEVECMLEFTNTFGDIDSRFYDSMCSIYHDVMNQILKNPELLDSLDARLRDCISGAADFGWGVAYTMRQEYEQMIKACSGEHNK